MSWRIRVDLWLKRFLRGGSATRSPKSTTPPRNTWRGQQRPQPIRKPPPDSSKQMLDPRNKKTRWRDWRR